MADPLRRTLLAKLRGKKSKKGTTAGGCGVAANGGREGKDKVLQTQAEQTQQAIIIAELNFVPDTMKGNDSCFIRRFDNGDIGFVHENTVVENTFSQCEASVHINTRRWDIQCSEDLRLRGRVNEELLGVSVQRETQEKGSDSDEMSSFNTQELNFTGQVRPGSCGRSQGQKKHPVPIPRQYSGGDSIGFGMCENHVLKCRMVCTDMGPREFADGQYPVSKNSGTNVGCKKDLKTRCDETDFCSQSEDNLQFMETLRDIKDTSVQTDHSQVFETNAIRPTNGTQLYRFGAPYACHKTNADNAEEHILIRNIESYGNASGRQSEDKVGNLQSPTFFPTELEICDANVAPRYVGFREGAQRHNSLDSEDDDYYDNEILPFYEANCQNLDINVAKASAQVDTANSEVSDRQDTFKNDTFINDTALETDRLRTQLKEAYYLLINAMHDISFDGQVSINGFVDKASTSSHSQDSVCSQSSAKAIDSDAWSSGENSSQQVSDNDAVPQNVNNNPELCGKNFLISKSSENLSCTKIRPTLRRSVSDGAIKYPKAHHPGPKILGSRICFVGKNGNELNNLAGACSQEKQLEYDGVSSDDLLNDNGDDGLLNESSGSVNSLTGSSDNAETQGNKQDFSGARAVSARPHGVTVNKMQEWMHKGRMLSSEMKQRITGSSLRAHGPSSLRSGHGVSNRTKAATQMTRVQGSKSVAPCQGAQQSALIENVHSSITATRELRVSAFSETRSPLNTITVSKKRNWLQQSSGKDGLPTTGAVEDHGQAAGSPGPPSEGRRPAPPIAPGSHCKPLRLHLSHVAATHARTGAQPRAVDPAEENDADDEGEIWYNPIPEDEEPELGPHGGAARLQVPPAPERAPPQRRSSGRDSERARGVSPTGLEGAGECQGSPGNEASHANTTHSTEPAQLHRQMFACKPADENSAPKATASDGTELSNPGFSPPSSPNPLKKGSAINWSFPDKIKSPRTVRKLSMKMKKLPELSRKLSVKGTPSISLPEPRPSSPKSHGGVEPGPGPGPARLSPGVGQTAASRNVISRYHLDSSVSTQHSYSKKSNSGGSKSASKGGYLSDGDSPELVAKSGKHGSEGKAGKSKESPANCSPKLHGTELDIDAFRHYSFTEQPKCAQYISGLMSLHFYGAEDLKPPRMDSRDVYCAIQVDSVNKARTALLTCRTTFLDMDHTFNIELENAQHLKLVVFSWEPTPRKNRVCCHGTVVLPTLFRVTKTHQLAVKLEPRGMIYVKLNLMDQWQNSLDGPDVERDPQVFGVEAWRVVEREGAGLMVPLLIERCITEIEKRGCQVVGLYRLCGSAAVKKELREAFERDSRDVELSENQYPDINVITGVLKDYLRELPSPLITKQLYEAVLDSMAKRPLRIGPKGCENDPADSEHTVGLLEILPEVEKVTLRKLLDHLKLVASHHEVNKMTCQNLAVCFGPVLLSQRQEASCHSNRVFIDSEELASALHFKKHIEVLHYLLQLWPVVDPHGKTSAPVREAPAETPAAPQYLRRRRERPQVLNLSEAEMAGVLRPKPGRLDSPSNRYAGDWSCCGDGYFQPPTESAGKEADYDDVPSEDAESTEEGQEKGGEQEPPVTGENDGSGEVEKEEAEDTGQPEESAGDILSSQEHLAKEHTYQAYMKIQEISPVLSNRVNLKDLQESIDTLIGNLERELNKNKFNVGY